MDNTRVNMIVKQKEDEKNDQVEKESKGAMDGGGYDDRPFGDKDLL